MRTACILDVDGTLTPHREIMAPDFREWFLNFQRSHDTYLVTGSDYANTLLQLGFEVCDRAKLLFNCCGNEVRKRREVIYQADWSGSVELMEALEHELEIVSFRKRTGNHIETRSGLINFSVIGRNANKEQRAEYVAFDSTRFERRSIIARLEHQFHDLDFAVAGETGIDIYPMGCDKGQVLKWIDADHTIFFGDATYPGGNDRSLALKCDQYHAVEGWQHTWNLLIEIDKHTK